MIIFISFLLPLISIGLTSIFGRFFGRCGSILINTIALSLSCLFSWYNLYLLLKQTSLQYQLILSIWFPEILGTNWIFSVDSLSSIMLVVITTISMLVHIYSLQYMKNDPHIIRFFIYLNLFTVFMLILVLSNNILILFLGWEGVGLCSYLLINFWFTRLQANKSALKALIVNRIGDIFLLFAIGLTFEITYSLDFSSYYSSSYIIMSVHNWITLSCLFYLIAAIGKSAQFGLHTWLPDAMEGPTPVSALIHAATMVTAGVFLLIRLSVWLNLSKFSMNCIIISGAITALFAGSVGLVQHDIKRVIAYSTCSQLGYMILICGCSAFTLGLFHLFNHAFFKALLFLGSGSIIHAINDEQDMRKYGSLNRITPLLTIVFMVSSIALIGFPFFSGFYSKDSILEILIVSNNIIALWGFWLGLAAATLTTGYSIKLLLWTFYISSTSRYYRIIQWHSLTSLEYTIFIILAILSIFIGYIFSDQFLGFGSQFFSNIIENKVDLQNAEFLPVYIKLLPLFITVLSLFFFNKLFSTSRLILFYTITNYFINNLWNFLSHKWYFNVLQNIYISQKTLDIGYNIFWIWDKLLLEQMRIKRN